jgi:hypothetical protein
MTRNKLIDMAVREAMDDIVTAGFESGHSCNEPWLVCTKCQKAMKLWMRRNWLSRTEENAG